MNVMNKYIQIYDNVISEKICKDLIYKFELSKDQQVTTDLENHRHFTEINLNEHIDWQGFAQGLYTSLKPYIQKYREDCQLTPNQWPEKYGFEQIRFKRYMPNDKDEFKSHVDVGDYASARRFLVFFLYLDDNEEGWTGFDDDNLKVQPKAGRLLMFPPTWTFPHTAYKAKNKPKYIVGSYLHYL